MNCQVGNWAIQIWHQYLALTFDQDPNIDNFLVKCTISDELTELEEAEPSTSMQDPAQSLTNTWKIYLDGSSNFEGSRARIVIAIPKKIILEHPLHFEFPVINNDVEYEAMTVGPKIAI